MRGYNGRWNEIRATKSLGWQTPNQCVEASVVRAMVYLKLMVEKYPDGQQPIYRYDQDGNAVMSVPKNVPLPSRKIKFKKPSAVDRYMQWHDKDQKKTYNAFLPALPVMSQIFPLVKTC